MCLATCTPHHGAQVILFYGEVNDFTTAVQALHQVTTARGLDMTRFVFFVSDGVPQNTNVQYLKDHNVYQYAVNTIGAWPPTAFPHAGARAIAVPVAHCSGTVTAARGTASG